MRMLFSRRAPVAAPAVSLPTLAIAAPVAAFEGNSGSTIVNFPVTRAGATTVAVRCDWSVTGSGASPAAASDFAGGVLPSGTLLFAIGETAKTIGIPVAGDTAFEPDEGFTVTLANPIGALIGQASAATTILNDDAPAPFTPAAMATPPVRAWDTRSGVTAASGAISAIAGAWGTTIALSGSSSPTLLAGGGPQPIGGTAPDIVQTTATSSQSLGGIGYDTRKATLGTAPDVELWFVVAPRGGNMPLIGNTAGTTSSVQINSSRDSLNVKTATSGNVTVPLPYALTSGAMYVLRVQLSPANGARAFVNGQAANGGAWTTTGWNDAGFNLLALCVSGANFASLYLGPVLIFANLLSDADAANLASYLQPFVSTTYYAAAAGSDGNLGWNQAGAFATADKFVAVAPAMGGAIVTFAPKGGDVFRRTAMATLPLCVFDGGLWGTGYAEYRASIRPTDWVLASGTAGTPGCVWSRGEAVHPYGPGSTTNGYVFDTGVADAPTLANLAPGAANAAAWHRQMDQWCAANPAGQRLRDGGKGAAPDAGSYGYDATAKTIYVALADGGNPNDRIEIARRTTTTATASQMQAMFQIATAGTVIRRTRIRYIDGAGLVMGGDQSTADRLDIAYCMADGLDANAAGTKLNLDCRVMYVGTGAADGSDGDGYSNHGGAMTRTRCYSGWADRGGYDDVEYCAANNYGCRAFGQRPFMTPGNGTGDASRAVQNFWNCVGTLPDGRTLPSLVHNRGAYMNLYGCTLVGTGAAPGKVGSTTEVRSGGGSNTPVTTITDCIVAGVESATVKTGGAGATSEDHNIWRYTGSFGVSPIAATSLTADPRFVNATGFDYSLASGSPAKGAGAAVAGLTIDYAGATQPAPPSIGAFEAA